MYIIIYSKYCNVSLISNSYIGNTLECLYNMYIYIIIYIHTCLHVSPRQHHHPTWMDTAAQHSTFRRHTPWPGKVTGFTRCHHTGLENPLAMFHLSPGLTDPQIDGQKPIAFRFSFKNPSRKHVRHLESCRVGSQWLS
jgi:hypothetical protein